MWNSVCFVLRHGMKKSALNLMYSAYCYVSMHCLYSNQSMCLICREVIKVSISTNTHYGYSHFIIIIFIQINGIFSLWSNEGISMFNSINMNAKDNNGLTVPIDMSAKDTYGLINCMHLLWFSEMETKNSDTK